MLFLLGGSGKRQWNCKETAGAAVNPPFFNEMFFFKFLFMKVYLKFIAYHLLLKILEKNLFW